MDALTRGDEVTSPVLMVKIGADLFPTKHKIHPTCPEGIFGIPDPFTPLNNMAS
jgi:hypothetical protein